MDNNEFYRSLPVDLSGSRSKNRFRLELLWGLGKLIDLMDTVDDFTVVFDYVCDIEVHLPNGFEFYQLKTHSSSMTSAFCIEEITIDSIKRLNSVFVGSGSNKNISTIIWYMAIIQVRNEFNKDAIRFPFVIDSPNNVETDDEKKFKVIQYILDHASISPQMIMSAIGFVPEDYSLDDKSINIIYLGNEKWHLLNEQDYHQNYNLLKELSEAL